ncbi:MYCBP-associated protein-like [Manduca sexta]|uniref:MYCBP-associated protein-like n=1 Tax=Manduca sexta TaxID=7130 RepID=UPI00188F0814|nr:MYCBP-associated protein-like [Manduca sexta]
MQNDLKPEDNVPKTESDNELQHWERWVTIRKDETTQLGQKLNRSPADLTMNLLEKVREDKERKIVLEEAQVEKKPTIRGGLWEQPHTLRQDCYCDPVYEIRRTPAEMGRPRVIEYIGVPHYIQVTEKGVMGEPKRVDCKKLDADYHKYRAKREQDLKRKIKKIDPFRPAISELIIKGSRPKTPPVKMPPVPAVSETLASGSSEDVLSGVYALRINNTVIFKYIPGQTVSHLEKIQKSSWHEECTAWNYYFNTPMKRPGRCRLFLQNLGTVSLRYCWKKVKKPIPFIPEDIYEQVFFFNKNEDVLAPGQSREMCFTFVSDKPGIYSEFWELSLCNICFFDTLASKLVINLFADAVEDFDTMKRKVEILKTRINRKAVANIVTNLLNDLVTKATAIEPQIYPYKKKFLEADIFVMKNPVCFYHQTEVMKMKTMYTEMHPGEIWDLSITSWRDMMMEKEYDERMKYYESLRKSHAELLKPWYEGEDVMMQKYRMMKVLFAQMADNFDKEYERLLLLFSMRSISTTRESKNSAKICVKIIVKFR